MTYLASLVLRLFRRPPLEHQVTFLVVGKAVGWSLLAYVAYGLHLWVLVNSLVDPDLGTLILLTGAVSLGFTVGLIAFMFPSGFGVREAILIGAMTLLLTVPQATAVSLIFARDVHRGRSPRSRDRHPVRLHLAASPRA